MLFNYNYDIKLMYNYNDMMFKCSIIMYRITDFYIFFLYFNFLYHTYDHTVSNMHTFKSDFTLQCNNGC